MTRPWAAPLGLVGNLSRLLLGYAILAMGTGPLLGQLPATWNLTRKDLTSTTTIGSLVVVITRR